MTTWPPSPSASRPRATVTDASEASGSEPGSAARWPLSRIVGLALLILLLFSVAAVVAGALALVSLHAHRERVVGTLDPAALQVQRL